MIPAKHILGLTAAAALVLAMALSAAPAGAASSGDNGQPTETTPVNVVSGVNLVSGVKATTSGASVAVSVECEMAKAAVRQAKQIVRWAEEKLQRADTAGEKRKARKRLRRAKEQLRKAREAKSEACTTPANLAPVFPSPLIHDSSTKYNFSEGVLISAVSKLTLNPASDPDGDPLTYTWDGPGSQAEGGNICAGLDVFGWDCAKSGPVASATWVRYAIHAPGPCIPEGTIHVTVSDGKGGEDVAGIHADGNC